MLTTNVSNFASGFMVLKNANILGFCKLLLFYFFGFKTNNWFQNVIAIF